MDKVTPEKAGLGGQHAGVNLAPEAAVFGHAAELALSLGHCWSE